MKSFLTPQAFILLAIGNLYLVPVRGACQNWSPVRKDELVDMAPQSITNECAQAEKRFIQMLARFDPKGLKDTTLLKKEALRAGFWWKGCLDADTNTLNIIVYYQCFESGFLAVFREDRKTNKALAWKSGDFGTDSSFMGEPEDINKDGRKEVFFYQKNRRSLNTALNLYTWDGSAANLLVILSGQVFEFKDLNENGIKELIVTEHTIIWSSAGDSLVKVSEFYSWDGNSYKLSGRKRAAEPIKDK